jgi:hypothetical protein
MTRIRSTAPRHIMRRYLSGQCDSFATVLAKASRQPLWAMKNKEGRIEHVFVRDAESGLAMDIRGAMPLDEISEGSALAELQHHFIEVSAEEVTDTFGIPTPTDLREARRALKDHFSRVLEKVAELPAEADHSSEDAIQP